MRAVQAVGTQMGVPAIAEYVETEAIRGYLATLGIQYGQGHAIALPKPIEEFPLPGSAQIGPGGAPGGPPQSRAAGTTLRQS